MRLSDLYKSKLYNADLRKANLQGADLDSTFLQGANLGEALMQGVNLRFSSLQNANLSNTSLQGADLKDVSLLGAELKGTKLQGASLEAVSLQGAKLRFVSMQGADLSYTQMQGADLRFVLMNEANLNNTSFRGAYLKSVDLEGAVLNSVDLEGAYWNVVRVGGTTIIKSDLSRTWIGSLDTTLSESWESEQINWKKEIPKNRLKNFSMNMKLSAVSIKNFDENWFQETHQSNLSLDELIKIRYKLACSKEENIDIQKYITRGLLSGFLDEFDDELIDIVQQRSPNKTDENLQIEMKDYMSKHCPRTLSAVERMNNFF